MNSSFGNYVIQSLYEFGDRYVQETLIDFLLENKETVDEIKKSSFGKFQ